MNRAPIVTIERLADGIAGHMKSAGREYERMTLGWAAWWAPEAYYRDFVARALFKRRIHSTPEVSFDSLRSMRAERRGRPPANSGARRIDLVVWNNNQSARAALEFKREMNCRLLAADVKRLREIGRQANAPKYTLLATFATAKLRGANAAAHAQARELLEEKAEALCREHGIARLAWRFSSSEWNVACWDPYPREILYAVFKVSPLRQR